MFNRLGMLYFIKKTTSSSKSTLHRRKKLNFRKVCKMKLFRRLIGRIKLKLRKENHIVGWSMTPDEVQSFFNKQGGTILTFFGFSGMGYENETGMLKTVQEVLSEHSPQATIVNIGATRSGIGAAYPLAKSMGFRTTGIASSESIVYPEEISDAVDYVCFVADKQWGGKLPDSEELSPTSESMVSCSDILVGIGGNDISRDEMLAGKARGKPVYFYPAEINHARAIRRAEYKKQPKPDSFWGTAHEIFGQQG